MDGCSPNDGVDVGTALRHEVLNETHPTPSWRGLTMVSLSVALTIGVARGTGPGEIAAQVG
jgi:hypothetical protein